jgi:hypothetical protein
MKYFHPQPHLTRRGFALISVLLILVVLTIMTVAFLQSVRIDRLTARAYLNKAKAEMVAKSGAQLAINDLLEALTRTDGTATRLYTTELRNDGINPADDLGYVTTITRWEEPSPGTWVSYSIPLASKLQTHADFESSDPTLVAKAMEDLFTDRDDASLSIDLNRNKNIQVKTDTYPKAYRAVYQDMLDKDGNVVGKYAYIIVDEQAKLNPSLHTGQTRDNYGETASEIPITLGDDSLLNPSEQAGFSKYFSAFQSIKTPYSIGQVFGSPDPLNPSDWAHQRKHLFSYYSAPNEDFIPAGYPDSGKPKYNINDLATDVGSTISPTKRAEDIADIIDRNLPDFKYRDPSFDEAGVKSQSINYVNRIAASIVDYIDSDFTSTAVNGSEPAGKDLHPMVAALAENLVWMSQGPAPDYDCAFRTRYYVQLWNPYTETVTGKATIEILERPELFLGNGGDLSLADYKKSTTVTIEPNEFKVVEFDWLNETVLSARRDLNKNGERPTWTRTSSTDVTKPPHPYFKFYWDDLLVDITRRAPVVADVSGEPSSSGLPKTNPAQSNSSPNSFKLNKNRWSTHFMPIAFSSTDGYRRIPEPRANYISNYDWTEWVNSSYDHARWGGRQDHTNTIQDFVDSLKNREPIRANPNLGNFSTDTNKTPLELSDEASSSNTYNSNLDSYNAPFFINNSPMKSIGELGNIFDPVQASDTGEPGNPKSSSGKGVGVFGPGGGRHLRIGQPEPDLDTNPWDEDGKRAIQLIDLFTTNAVVTGNYPTFPGRVNINTASREVLAALFYGISIKSDKGIYHDSSGNEQVDEIPMMTAQKSLALADQIIKERTDNGPFKRLSDLHRISSFWNRADAFEPTLGTPVPGEPDAIPRVMDRAREELFSKTVNLITTQSRAFRIYVVGQSLNNDQSINSTSYGEVIVEVDFETDTATNTTNLTHKITYSRF